MKCGVCDTSISEPLFESGSERSLTSLCELQMGQVRVWSCTSCGHLSSDVLANIENFYDTEYRILLDHEDEDQIYEVVGDKVVYRTDHQVSTLMSKLDLHKGARILDYGCAKASTPRRLTALRPDLDINLFDVSAMYTNYWEQFLPSDKCAIYETPSDWQSAFDVVTSFFALEHIPKPGETVRQIASLLNEDGVFYGIVPDTFGNVADFVVIDHVNHFTHHSLDCLLRNAGFVDVNIDSDAHRGALIFTARKMGQNNCKYELEPTLAASRELATYWSGMGVRMQAAESKHAGSTSAIYGSGFYGAYILSLLREPHQVECFLDASPFQQGKVLFDRKVLAPSELPDSVSVIYVGLNPKIARDVMAEMDWLEGCDLTLIYLD